MLEAVCSAPPGRACCAHLAVGRCRGYPVRGGRWLRIFSSSRVLSVLGWRLYSGSDAFGPRVEVVFGSRTVSVVGRIMYLFAGAGLSSWSAWRCVGWTDQMRGMVPFNSLGKSMSYVLALYAVGGRGIGRVAFLLVASSSVRGGLTWDGMGNVPPRCPRWSSGARSQSTQLPGLSSGSA